MKYTVKNKTTSMKVLLIDGVTRFLYPIRDKKNRDKLIVTSLTPQLLTLKNKKFIQLVKMKKNKEAN